MSVSLDPRMARSRKAMLDAARDLLVREGPAAVTHQHVALEASVGRATVYRHWPRTDQLLLDAMALVDFPFFRDPTTPVRPWLRRELRVLADEMALPPVAAIALAMMQGSAQSLPVEVRDRFRATGSDRIRAALALAGAAGELDGAADPKDASALLVGPILQRTCMEAGTVSDDLIDRIIDSVGTWHTSETSGLSQNSDELATARLSAKDGPAVDRRIPSSAIATELRISDNTFKTTRKPCNGRMAVLQDKTR